MTVHVTPKQITMDALPIDDYVLGTLVSGYLPLVLYYIGSLLSVCTVLLSYTFPSIIDRISPAEWTKVQNDRGPSLIPACLEFS